MFDTETTGLSPSGGDEIVSIGAVRIVNGRLLEHEVFEQLVNPATQHVARGGPDHRHRNRRCSTTSRRSTRFCRRSCNSAKTPCWSRTTRRSTCAFCRLKEEATGIRFTQPVLDTLLLSAVIHPDFDAHALEAIAERMGVNQIGRHTALGDAIMTGEVFLRMIPLLAEQGIHTLGEAREASQKTYFARIEY